MCEIKLHAYWSESSQDLEWGKPKTIFIKRDGSRKVLVVWYGTLRTGGIAGINTNQLSQRVDTKLEHQAG